MATLPDGARRRHAGAILSTEQDLRRLAADAGLRDDDGLVAAIAAAMRERGLADPALCGDVYESQLALDRTRRRADGAYYTPRHVVALVVERTLAPLLANADAESALRLRIADPSCGGGAFLLEVLRALERHCLAQGEPADGLRRRIVDRCLVGFDIDPRAVAVTRLALRLAAGDAECAPAIIERDALRGDDVELFDAVVGNPPWGQKGLKFSKADAAFLRRRYETATGVLDPFKLFVERTHELIRPHGRWGLVLPDIVLLKNHQPVRDLMRTRSRLDWIVDLGRVFEGVNLDAVAIVGARVDAVVPSHDVRIWRSLPHDWQSAPPPTHRRAQGVFGQLPGHRFNIHTDDASLELALRLRSGRRLGDVIAFHEGVHSGNMRAKLFVNERPDHGEACPLVLGRREVAAYRVAWSGRWIDLAAPREPGDYANLGRHEWHRVPKLVVRRTGDRVIAAYDDEGVYFSNNVFVAEFARETSVPEQRAWVAVLNSRFMTWYFRAIQPRTGRLFAELKIEHLREFPAPPVDRWAGAWPELSALCERMERAARDGADDHPAAAAIDDAVCDMFALSPRDRLVVTNSAL